MKFPNRFNRLPLACLILAGCGSSTATPDPGQPASVASTAGIETTELPAGQFPADLSWLPRLAAHDAVDSLPPGEFEQVFYVAPDGDDDNAGDRNRPFASFARARDAVRAHLDGEGHIAVYFREGEYVFDETLVLSRADSGSETQVVVYASYPGETAVFSSLAPLTNWQAVDEGLYRAPLPENMTQPRFLHHRDHDWLPRSATPVFLATEFSQVNGGCLECNWDVEEAQAARLNVQYPSDFPQPDWQFAAQYDLRQSTIAWVQEILPLDRVDESERRLHTRIPASLEMRLNFEEAENLNRNWVLNSLEGLDEAGEWASLNGFVYYRPEPEEDFEDELAVPALVELIRIDNGQADGNAPITEPVSHIRFAGIHFTGGDFYAMGDGDITTQHDWSVVDAPTALLRLRNVEEIVIEGCRFDKSGSTGLRLDRYARQIIIRNNEFEHLGREAIVLSGRGPGYGDVNGGNDISYNRIARTGLEKWTAPAIVIDQSSDNFVHHNLIEDTEFTAIALTAPRQLAFLSRYESDGPQTTYLGREFHYFEMGPRALADVRAAGDEGAGSLAGMAHVYNHDNYVEYNTLVDVGQGAGYLVNGYVYNSAVTPGRSNYINYNYVHDTGNHTANNAAFYSDSDQDYTSYIGNMISGLQNADEQPEAMPIFLLDAQWAETETNTGTRIPALANLVIDSRYHDLQGSLNAVFDGTVLDDNIGNGQYMAVYRAMLDALVHHLPGRDGIPGEAEVRRKLEAVIAAHQ